MANEIPHIEVYKHRVMLIAGACQVCHNGSKQAYGFTFVDPASVLLREHGYSGVYCGVAHFRQAHPQWREGV